ncbi:LPD7 domain-containing protein [Ferrovum sp.]|uniref:LPD7 domain-containing protein n=1 Tax=Ferrovum sp. TaxID=2609467 RepID=UPI0026174854|nr:LPD7 domain-containing protein [Ferrovum sp.]
MPIVNNIEAIEAGAPDFQQEDENEFQLTERTVASAPKKKAAKEFYPKESVWQKNRERKAPVVLNPPPRAMGGFCAPAAAKAMPEPELPKEPQLPQDVRQDELPKEPQLPQDVRQDEQPTTDRSARHKQIAGKILDRVRMVQNEKMNCMDVLFKLDTGADCLLAHRYNDAIEESGEQPMTDEGMLVLLTVAQHEFGSPLTVYGNDEFIKRAHRVAQEHGIALKDEPKPATSRPKPR